MEEKVTPIHQLEQALLDAVREYEQAKPRYKVEGLEVKRIKKAELDFVVEVKAFITTK